MLHETLSKKGSITVLTGAGSLHVLLAIIFFCARAYSAMWYNVFSVFIYALLIFYLSHEGEYVRPRTMKIAVCAVHLEVILFCVICTHFLGTSSNCFLYLLSLASCITFNPFEKREQVFILPTVECLIACLLFYLHPAGTQPANTLISGSVFLPVFNAFGAFSLVIFGNAVAQKSTRQMQQERLAAITDEMTGLYNREYLYRQIDEILARNKEQAYLVVYTNIAGFKYINTLLGTETANDILKLEAEGFRRMEGTYEVCGRLSGDEFGLLIRKEKFDEQKFIQDLQKIEGKFSGNLYRVHIYASAYEVNNEEDVAWMAFTRARIAASTIKEQYLGGVAYYNKKMVEDNKLRQEIVGMFNNALQTGQFSIHLQPQVDEKGNLTGAEALARWTLPDGGSISPGVFIPILEEFGLICDLDRFIWEEAIKQIKSWEGTGFQNLRVSVNISVKDIETLDIYQVLTELLEKYKIDAGKLSLEITESVMMSNPKDISEIINKLRANGFRVEIDDFGSGYSSLNMLKDISVDTIKLDMLFLKQSEETDKNWLIIESMIDLAKKLGISTISEGVETQEQYQNLVNLGCNIFQGYYFAKPMSTDSFHETYGATHRS